MCSKWQASEHWKRCRWSLSRVQNAGGKVSKGDKTSDSCDTSNRAWSWLLSMDDISGLSSRVAQRERGESLQENDVEFYAKSAFDQKRTIATRSRPLCFGGRITGTDYRSDKIVSGSWPRASFRNGWTFFAFIFTAFLTQKKPINLGKRGYHLLTKRHSGELVKMSPPIFV